MYQCMGRLHVAAIPIAILVCVPASLFARVHLVCKGYHQKFQSGVASTEDDFDCGFICRMIAHWISKNYVRMTWIDAYNQAYQAQREQTEHPW